MNLSLSKELEQEQAHYDSIYALAEVARPLPPIVVTHGEEALWDRYVGSVAGKQVLECGSGDGEKSVWLASQGAFVQAVELSPNGVERTRERARYHRLQDRVRAYQGDCTRLQDLIAPSSIDIALGFSVLHHLPAREFGRSLAIVLKPGGHAVFFENSNANPLYRLLRRVRNNESACGSPLTQAEVRELTAQVGDGFPVFPRFGLFGLAKSHIFKHSVLFARVVDTTDRMIDTVPAARRWSAHMWVVLLKQAVPG
jgi:2-polyprenyl-3-methyl-5-hydroxy-6-metoxy-1,4-benzoquinol methylase